MRETMDKMFTYIRESFGKLSRRRKIMMAILALVIVVLAIVIIVLLSSTKYELLVDAQDEASAGTIFAALEDMGVQPRMEGRTRVMVPEGRANELLARLSSNGVVGPGGLSLDIMAMAANFNVTESHARMLYQAQKAADIRVAVLRSSKIQDCVVILNMGQTSAYYRPTSVNQPTATVVLTVGGDATLTQQEAQSIAEIVRNAVPGIAYENITITDQNLYTYKVGETEVESFDDIVNSRVALRNLITRQLEEAALQLLTPVFGMSNVEVSARVELGWDLERIEALEYDPPVAGELDGIAVSASELWEAARVDAVDGGIPGTDTNAMGAIEYPYGTLQEGELYEKWLREKNFLVNETRTLIEKEQGAIRSLFIGVTINEAAADGRDFTLEVTDLVSRGLGVPVQNVSVQRMPFLTRDDSLTNIFEQQKAAEEAARQQELVKTIIQWAVILLLGIAIISLIAMIARGSKPPPEPEPEPVLVDGTYGPYGTYGTIDYVAGDDYDYSVAAEPEAEEVELNINKKSSGLEQIEKFIDKDPAAVAQLLRNWLTDE